MQHNIYMAFSYQEKLPPIDRKRQNKLNIFRLSIRFLGKQLTARCDFGLQSWSVRALGKAFAPNIYQRLTDCPKKLFDDQRATVASIRIYFGTSCQLSQSSGLGFNMPVQLAYHSGEGREHDNRLTMHLY